MSVAMGRQQVNGMWLLWRIEVKWASSGRVDWKSAIRQGSMSVTYWQWGHLQSATTCGRVGSPGRVHGRGACSERLGGARPLLARRNMSDSQIKTQGSGGKGSLLSVIYPCCQGNMTNVTEWHIRSWYWRPGLPVRRLYKVAMSAHYCKSLPVLIWP